MQTRGESASRLLSDPLFRDTLDLMERDCFDAFRATKYNEKEKREELWTLLKNAERFRGAFEIYARIGRNASAQLRKEEREREARKNPLRRVAGFFNRRDS